MGRRQIKTCEPGYRPESDGTGDARAAQNTIEWYRRSISAFLLAHFLKI